MLIPTRNRSCFELKLKFSSPLWLRWERGSRLHLDKKLLKVTRGFFWIFLFYILYSTLLHLPPLRFHSEDAGLEPRSVISALAVNALTTRLDLFHSMLDLIHKYFKSTAVWGSGFAHLRPCGAYSDLAEFLAANLVLKIKQHC